MQPLSGFDRIFMRFDSKVDQAHYNEQNIREEQVTSFPKIVKNRGVPTEEVEFIGNWKDACNPKEMAEFSSKFCKTIKESTRNPDHKINHLKHLQSLVHNHTTVCERKTSGFLDRIVEGVKAWFGQGKRAGLDDAHKAEAAIQREIAQVETDKQNMVRLQALPNFARSVDNNEHAKSLLSDLSAGSSIIWINKEGAIVRSTQSETRTPGYLNRIVYQHEEFTNPTAYFEAKAERMGNLFADGMDYVDDTPITLNEEMAAQRKHLIKYNAILNLPEFRAVDIPSFSFISNPETIGREIGTQFGRVAANAVYELQRSRNLPDFRVVPTRMENNQIVGFNCICANRSEKPNEILLKQFYIEASPDGLKIQQRAPDGSEAPENPVQSYATIEDFLSNQGLISQKDRDPIERAFDWGNTKDIF